MKPRVSIIMTAYNEGEAVLPALDRLFEAVTLPCEVLVVFDTPDDTTAPYLEKYALEEPRLHPTLNTYGRGPARAIRYGVDQAQGDVVVVTMADGSDDPQQIDQLARLVERGVVIASASRYSHGGQKVGGPAVKGLMSRVAGLTLYWFARVGTRDATSNYKAYSTSFVRAVGISSEEGFEVGLELVAKARRLRLPVAEIPTIWLDRTSGSSKFRLLAWLPRYIHWYRFAFGKKLSMDELRARAGRA